MAILDWPYFCILCNINGIKGLCGHKVPPSLSLGPALVLQWTLPCSYKTPDMALYILALYFHSIQQKWDQGSLGTQRTTLIGSRTHLGPSMDPVMALHAVAVWVVWHVGLHHDLLSMHLLFQEKWFFCLAWPKLNPKTHFGFHAA